MPVCRRAAERNASREAYLAAAPRTAGPLAVEADVVEGGSGLGGIGSEGGVAGERLASCSARAGCPAAGQSAVRQEQARRRREEPGLHGGRQPGQADGADLVSVDPVGGVVSGDRVAGT